MAMPTRLILLTLAALCLTMNVLVWRAEYGSKDNGIRVPENLVWRKIMTAPEASSLSVFQGGKRTGFCEFSTAIGQEMALMDESKPPPEGFLSHAGYQIRINGNASLGDFTNRIKFDGHLQFAPNRDWRSLDVKILMRGLAIYLQSAVSNQTVQITVTNEEDTFRRTFTYAELRDPGQLVRSLAGDFGVGPVSLLAGFELPSLSAASLPDTSAFHWKATRTRMIFGHEPVPVYRLETRVLDRPVVLVASTLGEVLRVELPGDIVATLDEWDKP
jgi:hypothetical protein